MKRLAALGAFQLSLYLNNRVDDALFKRYSRLISPDVTEEEVASYPWQPEALFWDNPVAAERYRRIWDHCQGDPIALTAVQLYLLCLMEERGVSLLREGLGLEEGLTIEAAGRIACRGTESIDMIPALRRAFGRVELLLQAEPGRDFLKAPFRLDGRLAAYLSGDDRMDQALEGLCTVVEAPGEIPASCLTGGRAEEVAGQLAGQGGFWLVPITGERGSGRRYFARQVAARLGRALLLVPFEGVSEGGRLSPRPWRRVLRELALSGRLLCLYGVRREERAGPEGLQALLARLEGDLAPLGRPAFLTTPPGVKVLPFLNCRAAPVAVPTPTIPQSAQLWQEFARQELEDPGSFPAGELAAKMTLTAGQMERIVRLLGASRPKGPWQARDIFKLCYQVLDDGRYENIRFVDTAYTWEDLKLPAPLKQALREVCAHVEHQGLVLDGWGLRRKFPYGRCVSVLFSGPPGTGKTMAAQVLASMLGLELYKVDLSQIADKYIGETEKRLKQVFDQAEKSNMVLFFDEADALLGKRTEVKESKDRYANTEVAYLLQRMEEYSGIAVMATNQAGNMDAAFVRRFRYHLVFPRPDEALRRALWEDVLTGIPAQAIHYGYLARQFELTGAQIKNIALNAAYRAAADGGVLKMEHLIRAVFLERQKEGKVMLASEFGEYGVMLSDQLARQGGAGV